MNRTFVAILAAMMLTFGYTVPSVKAADNEGSKSGMTSDRNSGMTSSPQNDPMIQGKTSHANQTSEQNRTWADSHEVNRMIGAKVKNSRGDTLGTINDFIIDDQGRINFAVVSEGGFLGFGAKKVLVPYETLSRDASGHFALNLSQDQFAAAPRFEDNGSLLSDRSKTDQIYRYYGVQPRWSDTNFSNSPAGSTQSQSSMGKENMNQPSRPGFSDQGTSRSATDAQTGSRGSNY